jgi:peptidyl-Lys metalloendopeptidase
LKVIANLTNTGDETLQVLNDPRSILTSHPTNSFTISDANGASPSFNGMKLKYSPNFSASRNGTSAFTILTPGQSVEVEHDCELTVSSAFPIVLTPKLNQTVSNAYNFTHSGESLYNIIPARTFYIADPETLQVSKIKAKVDKGHQSKLQGRLAVSRRANLSRVKRCDEHEHEDDASEASGPSFKGCNHKQKRQIRRAISVATKYATKTSQYVHYLSVHASLNSKLTRKHQIFRKQHQSHRSLRDLVW